MRYLLSILYVMISWSLIAIGMNEEHNAVETASPIASAGAAPVQPAASAQAVSSGPLVWQSQALKDVEVTTLNEERGNWVMKAKILKEAKKVFDMIQKKILAIEPLQEQYLKERTELDTAVNVFYNEYGVQSAEIDIYLKRIDEDIQKIEAAKKPLSEQERILKDETKRKKDALAELNKNFEYLRKLEDGLSQALITMSVQLHQVVSYGEQAWTNYEKIGDTLNDEIAQDLLHKMQILYENVVALEGYFTGELRNFFTNTIQKIHAQMDLLKEKIIALHKDGIALGKKMKALQEEEELQCSLQKQQKVEKKKEVTYSWYSPLVDSVTWVWDSLKSLLSLMYHGIMGIFGGSEQKVSSAKTTTEPVHDVKKIEAHTIKPAMVQSGVVQPVAVQSQVPMQVSEHEEVHVQPSVEASESTEEITTMA